LSDSPTVENLFRRLAGCMVRDRLRLKAELEKGGLSEGRLAGIEKQIARSEAVRMERAALARLSPEQRAVIVLRYYLDLSEDEMARRLETAPGTIKSRLHAARRRLAGLLRGRFSLDDWEETHERA